VPSKDWATESVCDAKDVEYIDSRQRVPYDVTTVRFIWPRTRCNNWLGETSSRLVCRGNTFPETYTKSLMKITTILRRLCYVQILAQQCHLQTCPDVFCRLKELDLLESAISCLDWPQIKLFERGNRNRFLSKIMSLSLIIADNICFRPRRAFRLIGLLQLNFIWLEKLESLQKKKSGP